MGNKLKEIKITRKNNQNNGKTKKKKVNPKINGIITSKKDGWINIKIYGKPFERGFAHGYLLSDKLKQITNTFPFIVENEFKQNLHEYIQLCNTLIKPKLKKDFPEFYDELVGISKGAFLVKKSIIIIIIIIDVVRL